MHCSSMNKSKPFSYYCNGWFQNSSLVNQGYLKLKMRELSAIILIRKWNMPPSGHHMFNSLLLFPVRDAFFHLLFGGGGKEMGIRIPGWMTMVSNSIWVVWSILLALYFGEIFKSD